ncbi:hypothetical protein ACJJTC_015883 [Scirpophaga incertulas]
MCQEIDKEPGLGVLSKSNWLLDPPEWPAEHACCDISSSGPNCYCNAPLTSQQHYFQCIKIQTLAQSLQRPVLIRSEPATNWQLGTVNIGINSSAGEAKPRDDLIVGRR